MRRKIVSVIVIGLLTATSLVTVNAIRCRPYIYVDDDNINGPWDGTLEHPFQFIQDGIDAAINSDTVFVFSGTYNEYILIGKSINLIGEDRNSTIITEGGEINYVDHAKVSGFTIKDTFDLDEVSNVIITGNIIKDISNDDTFIYGIKMDGSYNTIKENTFKNIDGDAFAIKFSGSNNNIIGNTISDMNDEGIGIYIGWAPNSTVIGNTITSITGIGIWVKGSPHSTIKENTITNIDGDHSAGIYVFSSVYNIIEENVITNINSGFFAVGINLDHSSNITIDKNTIKDVHCLFGGFGVYLTWSTYNFITRNNFISNSESARFYFSHYLEEGETYENGEIPDSFDETQIDSNTWHQNYWNRPRILPKVITGILEVYSHDGMTLLGGISLYNYDLDPLSKPSAAPQSIPQSIPNTQQSMSPLFFQTLEQTQPNIQ